MHFGWWDLPAEGNGAPADAEEEIDVFEPDPDIDGNDRCGGCYE
jgi:hypothetical protein